MPDKFHGVEAVDLANPKSGRQSLACMFVAVMMQGDSMESLFVTTMQQAYARPEFSSNPTLMKDFIGELLEAYRMVLTAPSAFHSQN